MKIRMTNCRVLCVPFQKYETAPNRDYLLQGVDTFEWSHEARLSSRSWHRQINVRVYFHNIYCPCISPNENRNVFVCRAERGPLVTQRACLLLFKYWFFLPTGTWKGLPFVLLESLWFMTSVLDNTHLVKFGICASYIPRGSDTASAFIVRSLIEL